MTSNHAKYVDVTKNKIKRIDANQIKNTQKIIQKFFILIFFISIFILLTRRKATEAHRVRKYPDLLPEISRYCCPLVI